MRIKTGLLMIGAIKALALLGYAFVARPRMLRWGATCDEVDGTLPGDELVKNPRYTSTRAITIHADTAEIWAWLVQMGQGRGGFYSYDRLQNLMGLNIHSLDRIAPELQDLKVGDAVRLSPEGQGSTPVVMNVTILEPEHALVLRTPGTLEEAIEAVFPYATWAFLLEPFSDKETRLIVRMRSDFKPTPIGLLINKYGLELPHFLMERKTMLGIKERAENTPSEIQEEAA